MSILKRILVGIIRRPFKSILLFLLTLSLGIFVGSSYLISKATVNVQSYIESKLDSKVKIQMAKQFHYLEVTDEMQDKILDHLYDVYNQIKNDEMVVDSNVNYINISWDFVSKLNHPNQHFFHEVDQGVLDIYGVGFDSIIDGINLLDGRFINEDDIDQSKMVAVVHYMYEHEDGTRVSVGDKLNLTYHYYDSDYIGEEFIYKIMNEIDYEVEVIGIYEDTTGNEILNHGGYITIMPTSTLLNMKDEIVKSNLNVLGREENNFYYSNYVFVLTSPFVFEEFKTKFIELMGEDAEYIEFKTTGDSYYEIKGTLDNMNELSIVIMVVSLISSVLIGMLVIYLYLKDRNNEVGILLSMGEKKYKILLQFVCEIMLISVLGLSLSLNLSSRMADEISNTILRNQLHTSNDSFNQLNVKNDIYRNFEIEMDDMFAPMFMIGGCFIVCISCALPIVYTMKSKVKDVLL